MCTFFQFPRYKWHEMWWLRFFWSHHMWGWSMMPLTWLSFLDLWLDFGIPFPTLWHYFKLENQGPLQILWYDGLLYPFNNFLYFMMCNDVLWNRHKTLWLRPITWLSFDMNLILHLIIDLRPLNHPMKHNTHTHTKTQLGMPWSSQDQGMTLQTMKILLTLLKNKYDNIWL